jgi:hypothetical protein
MRRNKQHTCYAGFWSDQSKKDLVEHKASTPGRLHWTLSLLQGNYEPLMGETDDFDKAAPRSPMSKTYYKSVLLVEPEGVNMDMQINMLTGEVTLSAFCLH